MLDTLAQATDALARNDADTLEALCADVPRALTATEAAAAREALLVFRRQILAARGNVILRQRLLAASREATPWAP